jgi:hypothetical protein
MIQQLYRFTVSVMSTEVEAVRSSGETKRRHLADNSLQRFGSKFICQRSREPKPARCLRSILGVARLREDSGRHD